MKQVLAVLVCALCAAAAALPALSDSTPVGPLPSGPTSTVHLRPYATYRATLPKPSPAGRVWRIARAFDSQVVQEVAEGETAAGAIWVDFRAVGAGTTRVVFALTRGETAHAYAARTFAFVVAGQAACPTGLLPLTANPIGPASAASLASDPPKNKPQVTGAWIAVQDAARGAQVKAQCGVKTWRRTVVVYVVDRAFLPSQSASQRVLFVGRTRAGYRVWQRAH
jgi:hypothetical protein